MNDEQLAADIKRVFGRYRMEAAPVEAPLALAPTHPPLHRRRVLGGLSFAGVAAAVVLAFALTFGLAPGGNPPRSAYAGWQPIPTKNDPAMRAVADASCLPILGKQTVLHLTLQDQRGAVALFFYRGQGDYWACFLTPNGHGGYDPSVTGISGATAPYIGVDHFGFTGGGTNGIAPAVAVMGETDAGKVVIERQDGVNVEATVSDGFFVAWWPGSAGFKNLIAYDASGSEIGERSFATPCICRVEPSAPNAGN